MYRDANTGDSDRLARLFWENLLSQPGYVSHGEMQMGVADAPRRPAADGLDKWTRYVREKIEGRRGHVIVREREGEIDGFVVVEVAEDGDRPFGVICDLLVRPDRRGEGTGAALLEAGMDWLRGQGVNAFYLESGIENHAAHDFFERHGFRAVSRVFRRDAPGDAAPRE
jgi:GNAT superfamily N-acetyltransferase